MPHRDDHDAALARADALQAELDRERASHEEQSDRIAKLETELREARMRLERAEETLGDIKPKPAPRPVDVDPRPSDPHVFEPGRAPVGVIVAGIVGMIVVAVVLVKCADQHSREPEERAPTRPQPVGPTTADALLKEALARVERGLLVEQIELEYVGSDGVLDPTYGRFSLKTRQPKPPRPADDPNRPTGAPEPADTSMFMARCPSPRWTADGGWVWDAGGDFCIAFGDDPVGRPRCTVALVLDRARADGAPDGLARIFVSFTSEWVWSYSITDRTRGVSFSRDYNDRDCVPPRVEQ